MSYYIYTPFFSFYGIFLKTKLVILEKKNKNINIFIYTPTIAFNLVCLVLPFSNAHTKLETKNWIIIGVFQISMVKSQQKISL